MKKCLGFLLIFAVLSSLQAEQEDVRSEQVFVPVPMQKRIQNVPMSRTPSWRDNLTTMWERDQFQAILGVGVFCAGFLRRNKDVSAGAVIVVGLCIFTEAYVRARDYNQNTREN